MTDFPRLKQFCSAMQHWNDRTDVCVAVRREENSCQRIIPVGTHKVSNVTEVAGAERNEHANHLPHAQAAQIRAAGDGFSRQVVPFDVVFIGTRGKCSRRDVGGLNIVHNLAIIESRDEMRAHAGQRDRPAHLAADGRVKDGHVGARALVGVDKAVEEELGGVGVANPLGVFLMVDIA